MNKIVITLAALAAGLVLGWLAAFFWSADKPASGGEDGGDEILYWVAPMDPNYRRDGPGKSPMGMDLVPFYANQRGAEDQSIQISAAVENSLGVRTAPVERGPLWRKMSATGYVGLDETRMSHIHLRTEGWIEQLSVAFQGEQVKQGQLLFELYSPELLNAQREYLRLKSRGNAVLQNAAAEKLQALGMSRSDLERLSDRGSAADRIRVHAPQDGIVSALNVREGMYVTPATNVMSLADLSVVWLHAEVFEDQAQWVALGQQAEARLNYLPGEVFSGQVDYVYPVINADTRNLRVRLRFDNPELVLKPNMYAQVSIYGGAKADILSIPVEALIRSGEQQRVVLALGEGRYRSQEVVAGMESGDWVEILRGLEEGQQVVTSAQFLIDSEASLNAGVKRLQPRPERENQRG